MSIRISGGVAEIEVDFIIEMLALNGISADLVELSFGTAFMDGMTAIDEIDFDIESMVGVEEYVVLSRSISNRIYINSNMFKRIRILNPSRESLTSLKQIFNEINHLIDL